MEVTIRQMREEDLTRDFLDTLTSPTTSDLDPKKAKQIFNEISSKKNYIILVAVTDTKVVGSATLLIEQKFTHNGCKVGHIEDVVVMEEYQKKGIGGKLVIALLDYAEKLTCYKTILNCLEENIPFYEKLGFKRHLKGMRFDHLLSKQST